MTTIRTYISTILLASCVLATMPNQAMNTSNNQLNNLFNRVRSSLPSMQNIGDFVNQARDTVIENRYIAAPALAVVVIGYCIYLKKRFFGRSAMVVKSSIQQDVVPQEIAIIPTKEVAALVQISPIAPSIVKETVEQEQVSPVVLPIVNDNQATQIIKVVNDHNQSLNLRISIVDDNDVVHQFSVPSYSNGLININ
ncbi:MAG: hypothetical protein P4L31_01140 [Candidatus Babeliales bacterium]|nr:hypothetical protein [Candidatus Babeliales bacterium]